MKTLTQAEWHDLLTPLIGRPYKFGADGPDAYDCWGLVRHLLFELGVPSERLPAFDGQSYESVGESLRKDWLGGTWERVETGRPGDAVLMARLKGYHHVGVVTPSGIIHADKPLGVCIQDEGSLKTTFWQRWVYFRWAA